MSLPESYRSTAHATLRGKLNINTIITRVKDHLIRHGCQYVSLINRGASNVLFFALNI